MITTKRLVLLLLTGIVMASVACSSKPLASLGDIHLLDISVEKVEDGSFGGFAPHQIVGTVRNDGDLEKSTCVVYNLYEDNAVIEKEVVLRFTAYAGETSKGKEPLFNGGNRAELVRFSLSGC